jgi:hypothetical protein
MIFFIIWIATMLIAGLFFYINLSQAIPYCKEGKKWIFWSPGLWPFMASAFEAEGQKYRIRGIYYLLFFDFWIFGGLGLMSLFD